MRSPVDLEPLAGDAGVGADAGTNTGTATATAGTLPSWREVLAVVAHPDDESFGLGGLIAAFVAAGSHVSVLCFTHGEASTLHGVDGDLASIRDRELAEAAGVLGVRRVGLAGYPDGALSSVPLERLVAEVAAFAGAVPPDGLLVFDREGVTGHPDHRRATEAALAYATSGRRPVLGWALPGPVAVTLNSEFDAAFSGYPAPAIDLRIGVDRGLQREAIACHRSQAVPGQALWRRLELSGRYEHARWQRDAADAARPGSPPPA